SLRQRSRVHRDLHSFPTRRSSDLAPEFDCEYLVTDSILDVPFFDNCSGAVIEHDFLTGPFDHTMQGARLPVGLNLVNWVATDSRSEEHTSELQSRENLVCRLLLEK